MKTVHFKVDDEPHIKVNPDACTACNIRGCVFVCPANLFTPLADGRISFNYEECFECGACYIVCNQHHAIQWSYPRGGFGVTFRES